MSTIILTTLVLEAKTPIAIHTGGRETGFDTQLVRDVNGLPTIPGTSIAGVWRRIACLMLGNEVADKWFGNLSKSSQLTVGGGNVHDSSNKPVVGLRELETLKQDALLALLLHNQPLHRDRVRLNDRGVAKDTGKFDQTLVPAGTRFSVDVQCYIDSLEERHALNELLALWQDKRMAFGSSTRNGLGQVSVIANTTRLYDLSDGPQAALALRDARVNASVPNTLDLPKIEAQSLQCIADYKVQGTDNWRIGKGSQLLGQPPEQGSVANITYAEPRVVWEANTAKVATQVPVVCGSSLKGIIAHRVLYHYNRHHSKFADQLSNEEFEQVAERWDDVRDLLGFAGNTSQDAKAGLLYVEDSIVDVKHTVLRHHNHIDRFTGGVRQGALFTEELAYKPIFHLRLYLDTSQSVSKALEAALNDTLEDIRMGLLPLAAGTSRGSGMTQVIEVIVDGAIKTEQGVAV